MVMLPDFMPLGTLSIDEIKCDGPSMLTTQRRPLLRNCSHKFRPPHVARGTRGDRSKNPKKHQAPFSKIAYPCWSLLVIGSDCYIVDHHHLVTVTQKGSKWHNWQITLFIYNLCSGNTWSQHPSLLCISACSVLVWLGNVCVSHPDIQND